MTTEKMEKLRICRVCLIENVRMYKVFDKKLQEFYEKLTSISLETDDRRPTLVCYMCYRHLQKCCQFGLKCLESEKMLAQIIDENKETNIQKVRHNITRFQHLSVLSVFQISISGSQQAKKCVVKEELPDDSQDGLLNIKEEICEIEVTPREEDYQIPKADKQVPVTVMKSEPTNEGNILNSATDASWKLDNLNINREVTVEIVKFEESEEISTEAPCVMPSKNNVPSTDNISKLSSENEFKDNSNNNCYNDIKISKNQPNTCHICMKSFSRKSTLAVHMLKHTGEKPFKCAICQCSFRQKTTLNNHIRTHDGEKPYKCDVCEQSFRVKCNLTNHIRTHTGEKPHQCNICRVRFNDRSHLNTHMRRHTGEKPYKCDICDRSFRVKGQLKRHAGTHTSEIAAKCHVCQKSFRHKYNLNAHLRLHADVQEKPHKCEICSRTFNRKSHLKGHLRTHTVRNDVKMTS